MRVTALTTSLPGLRKPRLLGFARVLREAGHEVSVVASTDHSLGGGGDAAEDLMHLKALGISVRVLEHPLGPREFARAAGGVARRRASTDVALYQSDRLAAAVTAAIDATRPDVLHVERTRALWLVRAHPAPKVVDVIDPRVIADRQYRGQGAFALRAGWRELIRAWVDRGPAAREEGEGLAEVPVLVASDLGRRALVELGLPAARLTDLPNPVFPAERAAPRGPAPGATPVIGMSGNLSYPPNVLGFQRFATDVLPALGDALAARCVLIGGKPHPRIRRVAERAGVPVHRDVASVPGTIRELGLAAMVSPQGISTGFPNRVVDAVYRAGVPIVCSPETVRGAPPSLAALLPVAGTAAEWVAALRPCLRPEVRDTVQATQDAIEVACGAETVAAALLAAYAQAGAR